MGKPFALLQGDNSPCNNANGLVLLIFPFLFSSLRPLRLCGCIFPVSSAWLGVAGFASFLKFAKVGDEEAREGVRGVAHLTLYFAACITLLNSNFDAISCATWLSGLTDRQVVT